MLTVVTAAAVAANVPFVFTVPGQQRWRIRSVFAQCATQIGGAPNRSYSLTVTDSSHTVAVAGAADAGTEPATVNITWANASSSAVKAGSTGIVVAAFPTVTLEPGYLVTGAVVQGVATDQWLRAFAWIDYSNT